MSRARLRYRPPRSLFRRFELLDMIEGGTTFCEVGPGDLQLATELLDRFERGTVVELDDGCRGFHAALAPDLRARLSVAIGPFEDMALAERFECVVCCEVLEHVEDDRHFLEQLRTLLVPGGIVALSVPSRMKYWTVHDEIVGHLRRYERDELTVLLQAAGFDDIEIRSYGFPWVNLLRVPRGVVARRQAAERSGWDQRRQTIESNHRQIPAQLAGSPLRHLTRPSVIAPLAWVSRMFAGMDLSDGYAVRARRR